MLAGVAARADRGRRCVVTDRLARSVDPPGRRPRPHSRDLAGGDTAARAAWPARRRSPTWPSALNLLADRIDELLAAERERVADLSHRLRTPLTALRLDAEGHGAAALVEDVDRLEAEVTELIRAARRRCTRRMTVRCDWRGSSPIGRRSGGRWPTTMAAGGPAPSSRTGPHLVRLADGGCGGRGRRAPRQRVRPHARGHAVRRVRDGGRGRVQLVVEDGGPGIADARPSSTVAPAPAGPPAWGSTSRPPRRGRPAASCASSTSETLGGARRRARSAPCRGRPVTAVDAAVRAEIERRGPIPFSEVVERRCTRPTAASTPPEGGPAGAATSSPAPRWARCSARWSPGPSTPGGTRPASPTVFTVVEAGAGPGTLARAVLAAAPRCAAALRYVLVERSAPQRALHAEHLALEAPASRSPPARTDDDDPSAVGAAAARSW